MSESSADVEVVAAITLRREQLRAQLQESTGEIRQWAQDLRQLPIELPVRMDLTNVRADIAQLRAEVAANPLVIPVQMGGMPGGMMVAGPGGMASPAAAAEAASYFGNRGLFAQYLARTARGPAGSFGAYEVNEFSGGGAFNLAPAVESAPRFTARAMLPNSAFFDTAIDEAAADANAKAMAGRDERIKAAREGGSGGMGGLRAFMVAHMAIRSIEEIGQIHSEAGSAGEALRDMYAGNATHQFRIEAAQKAIEDVSRINQRGLNPLLNWLTGQDPGNMTADDIIPRAKQVIERESIAERRDKIREQRFSLEGHLFGGVRHMEAEADQLGSGGGPASILRKINNDLAEELRAIKEHTTALAALNDGTKESKAAAQAVASTYQDRATTAANLVALRETARVQLETGREQAGGHHAAEAQISRLSVQAARMDSEIAELSVTSPYARSVQRLRDDVQETATEREQLARDYTERRWDLIRKASAGGWPLDARTEAFGDLQNEFNARSGILDRHDRLSRAKQADLDRRHDLDVANIVGAAGDIRLAGGHQIEPMFSRVGLHPSAGTLGDIINQANRAGPRGALTAAAIAHNRHTQELLAANAGDIEKQNAIREHAAAESQEMMDKLRNVGGEDARSARAGWGQEQQNMLHPFRGKRGGDEWGPGASSGADFGGGGGGDKLDIGAANQAFRNLANAQQLGIIQF